MFRWSEPSRRSKYPENIGTEHLLLALASCDGVAAAVLRDLGLTDQAIRAAIKG